MKTNEELSVKKACGNNILMLSFDSLGDIVLRQPMFAALTQKGYHVAVAVRKGFEDILPLLAPRLSIISIDMNPYREVTGPVASELEHLADEIRAFQPDSIICCPYQRTFLDEWILRRFATSVRYGFHGVCFPYSKDIGLPPPGVNADLFDIGISVEERAPDIGKNRKLLSALFPETADDAAAEYRPSITPSAAIVKKTGLVLAGLRLKRDNFVVMCPAGTANVRIKTWSVQNYAALADFIITVCDLPVLVMCHETELGFVNVMMAEVRNAGRCKVWSGRQTDMDVLVGLMDASRLYVGNDTGPMHIAAALNKPVVALFGGGHWPRFLPSADISAVFTQELPCFYCNWDGCIFEDAPCVKRIDPEVVKRTVQKMLEGGITEKSVHSGDRDVYEEAKTFMKGRPLGKGDCLPFAIIRHGLPKITIVTPSFNQGQYLEECIDSVLSQNYPNLEYIVMDGGSTDNSVEIIGKYEKYLTYWQSKPDGGHYQALDTGFKRSTGDIMAWLNSDDKYHRDALFSVAYLFLEHEAVEWLMGRPSNWDAYGNLRDISPCVPVWSREKYLNRIYKDPTIQQESVFWRRSLWEKAGGYVDHTCELAGDLELWRRFFRYAGLTIVDRLIGGFRNHPEQKTCGRLNMYFDEAAAVIEEEISLFEHGGFTDIPRSPERVELPDQVVEAFRNTVTKLGCPPAPPYVSSTDPRLAAARESLIKKEQTGIRMQDAIHDIEVLLEASEADRAARLEAMRRLESRVEEIEAERLEQIEQLTVWLKESEADRAARLERIHELENSLDVLKRTYHAMENTFVVRAARWMHLINIKYPVSADSE